MIAYSTQWNNCKTLYLTLTSEVYLGPCQTTLTLLFAKIVMVFQLLTFFEKRYIINIWQSPKYTCRRALQPIFKSLTHSFQLHHLLFFKLSFPIKLLQAYRCLIHSFRDSVLACKLRACC